MYKKKFKHDNIQKYSYPEVILTEDAIQDTHTPE
mgnify:CR=1 FL=1